MLDESSMIPYGPRKPRKPRTFLPRIPVPMVKLSVVPSIPTTSFLVSKCQAAPTYMSTNVKPNAVPFLTRSIATKIMKKKKSQSPARGQSDLVDEGSPPSTLKCS